MYSKHHGLLSALVGLPVAAAAPPGEGLWIWASMVVVGVGIDVDHFVVARLNRGDWLNVRRCLADPSLIAGGQEEIFDPGDLWRDQRLLSHLLIGGALVGALWAVDRYWAIAMAVTVYTHLVADLYSDARTREAYLAGEI